MESKIYLTHCGRVTHICVGTLTITGPDNGLSPTRRQAIIWTNAGLLLIWPLGTNFNEIVIKILTFSFKKMHLKMSSGKCRPFCLGLNVLTPHVAVVYEHGHTAGYCDPEYIYLYKLSWTWRQVPEPYFRYVHDIHISKRVTCWFPQYASFRIS